MKNVKPKERKIRNKKANKKEKYADINQIIPTVI